MDFSSGIAKYRYDCAEPQFKYKHLTIRDQT